ERASKQGSQQGLHNSLPPPGNPPQQEEPYEDRTPVTREEEGLRNPATGAGSYAARTPPSGWSSGASPVFGMTARPADPSLRNRNGRRQVNGPMQHRLGHDCALCDAHSKAALRHTARPHVRTMRYLPWIAPISLCVVLIPFVD